MDLTSEETNQLREMIRTASYRVAAQWPVTVEREDLEQDMLLHLLERKGALKRLFEEPDPQVRQAFLIKVGHQLASQQQRDYERFSGNYLYHVGQVRGLLDRKVWIMEDCSSSEKADLAEGIALLVEKNSGHYAAIINRFVHDIYPQESAEKMRLQRAVESLTEIMNRMGQQRKKNWSEGPGSRKVISNAAALHITRADYSG